MRLDSAGNMGLGVTPSAWGSGSYKVFQAGIASFVGGSTGAYLIQDNAYSDNTGSTWKYINSSYAASQYYAAAGAHVWRTAASGTAGNTISFTQAMTLDASGNLGIGETSPLSRLDVRAPAGELGRFAITNSGVGYLLVGGGSSTTEGLRLSYDNSDGSSTINNFFNAALKFSTNNTVRATIDSSGNFNATTSNATSSHKLSKGSATARLQLQVGESYPVNFYEGNGYGFSAAASLVEVSVNSVTSRSINAGGTINASGADYAEYMTKASDFTVAKGDVVGINAQGKLTNVFANAVSFVVKSTDPSYVGGDTWGSVDVIGQRPTEDATQEVKDAFNAALEAARQTVDRIAFAGQVPVNVVGATAGQYIIPVNNNGAIKGEAVSNPTFEQYQISVGKVISIESDGRARIIVKVA
jgi:hypothetical protein